MLLPARKISGWVLLVLLLVGALPRASTASTPLTAAHDPAALATVLNPDGTVQTGVKGSFDAKGFRLETAFDGRPMFRPTGTTGAGDQNWQDGFYLPGIGGYVNAIVTNGTDIYVAGSMGLAGNVPVANVAKWDGTRWHALGSGVSMEVYALLLVGTDLYAGGAETVNGSFRGSVAQWNGSAWNTLGTSMSSFVNALAIDGNGRLFAGRGSISGGGMVTQWNGSAWSLLGNGQLNGGVRALLFSGSDLYAGGDFTQANGVSANNIAKWNGTTWVPLGAGLNNSVWSLAWHGTDLYVGGRFTEAGSAPARYVARWDGNNWSALGPGIISSNATVSSMAFRGNDLYVCGQFGTTTGTVLNNVAKWDGTSWTDLGAGPSYSFRALALVGSDLYLGGQFDKVGGAGAMNIAKRSAGTWSSLGMGLNNAVHALAVHGTDIYVAGSFIKAGGIEARYIAKWDGSAWSNLGTGAANGTNNAVFALAVAPNGDLYAGGYFTEAGGAPARYVAKWNGRSWSAVGTGLNSPVMCLAVADNGDLYAGGTFTQAGGVAANYVARWNGTAWSALGSGVNGRTAPGQFVFVSFIAVRGSEVYVGGSNFNSAGGVAVNQLARWDGATWSDMGFLGSNGYVNALAASGNSLYVGGSFTSVAGLPISHLARWDGTSWNSVGPSLGGPVGALTAQGTEVYAGGRTLMANSTSLARWDGTAWRALGTRMGGDIAALAVAPNGNVAAGGTFGGTADGSRISVFFAVYRASLATSAATPAEPSGPVLFPNPAQRTAVLELPAASGARLVSVRDALGREVQQQVLPAKATALALDLRSLTPGMYLVQCGSYSVRLSVEH